MNNEERTKLILAAVKEEISSNGGEITNCVEECTEGKFAMSVNFEEECFIVDFAGACMLSAMTFCDISDKLCFEDLVWIGNEINKNFRWVKVFVDPDLDSPLVFRISSNVDTGMNYHNHFRRMIVTYKSARDFYEEEVQKLVKNHSLTQGYNTSAASTCSR